MYKGYNLYFGESIDGNSLDAGKRRRYMAFGFDNNVICSGDILMFKKTNDLTAVVNVLASCSVLEAIYFVLHIVRFSIVDANKLSFLQSDVISVTEFKEQYYFEEYLSHDKCKLSESHSEILFDMVGSEFGVCDWRLKENTYLNKQLVADRENQQRGDTLELESETCSVNKHKSVNVSATKQSSKLEVKLLVFIS
jgi:hypothetical protein